MSRSARGIGAAAWDAKWALFAPVIILGGIYGGVFTVTEASVVAVLYALLTGVMIFRKITFNVLFDALIYTVRITGTVLLVLVTGRIVGRLLTIYQIPQMVSDFLLTSVSSPTMLILLILLLLIFIGMWMETLTQIIILTPLLLPVAMGVGMHPIQFGIVFVIACEIGYSTPPLGVNLFVAAEIGDTTMERISKASVAFVPELTLWLPRLLGFIV
jgi:C4-dicarboxylate transporter DctM subunit